MSVAAPSRPDTTGRRISMPTFALRRRIAALVALAVFAVVLVVSIGAWLMIQRQLTQQTDDALIREATAVRANQLVDPEQYPAALRGLALPFQEVYSHRAPEKPAAQDVNLPVSSADMAIARGLDAGPLVRDVYLGPTHYRMVTVPYTSGIALQVAQDVDGQDSALHKLALLLFVVSLGGAGVAAAIGVGVARAGLAPVRALTAAAERVSRTDDLAPLALSGKASEDDEVARLAASFNAMLAALARSRERQRQLIADAGHELRTPLTSLRTNLELLVREDLAAGRVLPPEDRARLMADLTAQIEEMSTLVGDLTALARVGEETSDGEVQQVDLRDITERALERVRRRAAGLRMMTDLHDSPVLGRPQLLERAVTNILDNAAKWSPPGGEIFVGLRGGSLVVMDQGPGIAAEDLPHVFDRFYRARNAREMPGSGLGLSIVAQTAYEHGGTVTAEVADQGGTVIRFSLPPATAAPENPGDHGADSVRATDVSGAHP